MRNLTGQAIARSLGSATPVSFVVMLYKVSVSYMSVYLETISKFFTILNVRIRHSYLF